MRNTRALLVVVLLTLRWPLASAADCVVPADPAATPAQVTVENLPLPSPERAGRWIDLWIRSAPDGAVRDMGPWGAGPRGWYETATVQAGFQVAAESAAKKCRFAAFVAKSQQFSEVGYYRFKFVTDQSGKLGIRISAKPRPKEPKCRPYFEPSRSGYFNAALFGPQGELVVSGGMGAMLSLDRGRTWTLPVRGRAGSKEREPALAELARKQHLDWLRNPAFTQPPVIDKGGRSYRCVAGPTGIEVSDNGGRQWRRSSELACSGLALVDGEPYVLSNASVHHSKDRGATWSNGSDPVGSTDRGVNGFFSDKAGNLYVNQWDRVWWSADRGVSWKRAHWGLATGLAGCATCSGPNMLIIGSREGTIYFLAGPLDGFDSNLYSSQDGVVATLEASNVGGDSFWGYPAQRWFAYGPQGALALANSYGLFVKPDAGSPWEGVELEAMNNAEWACF